MRFNDFVAMLQNIHICKNPFPVDVSEAPEKLHLDFIKVYYDSSARSSFNKEDSITFHASFPTSQFSVT
jgi:hypothetical protein